ncbi:MAG: ATP-binding cassette domain-containing protein [Chlorobium sp.]|nr:MAG: ATP-binding cassette domain-containing protein [Chlorobium sp.]
MHMNQQQKSGKNPVVEFIDVRVTKLSPAGATMVILDRISFTALQGKITGIIGASGSGKSTLIRLCNRLDDPSDGTILLNGQNISTIEPLLLRRKVAMVLQKPFMFEGTLLENLQRPFLFRNIAPPSAKSDEITRVLDLVQLSSEMLARDARSLSGGEQQRVNLARALVNHPEVLLLDEPTSALDRPSTARLASTLSNICESEHLAIIVVTHDLYLAEHIVNHLIYLEEGQIVEQGDATSMLAMPQTAVFKNFLAKPESSSL